MLRTQRGQWGAAVEQVTGGGLARRRSSRQELTAPTGFELPGSSVTVISQEGSEDAGVRPEAIDASAGLGVARDARETEGEAGATVDTASVDARPRNPSRADTTAPFGAERDGDDAGAPPSANGCSCTLGARDVGGGDSGAAFVIAVARLRRRAAAAALETVALRAFRVSSHALI